MHIELLLQISRDRKRTFDGDFLFSRSRMCEKIYLDAHLAHRTLVRTGGIWNLKKSQSEFKFKYDAVKLEYASRYYADFV